MDVKFFDLKTGSPVNTKLPFPSMLCVLLTCSISISTLLFCPQQDTLILGISVG